MQTKYDELARLADIAIEDGAGDGGWFTTEQMDDGEWSVYDQDLAAACSPATIKAMHADLVALAAALRSIVSVGGESTSGDGHARCREIARAALARLKEPT